MYIEDVEQATFPWWLSTLGTLFAAATLFLLLAAVYVLLVRERQSIHPTTGQTRRGVGAGWRLAFQTRAGRARGFLRFWPLWEWFTRSIGHVQPIPDAPNHLLEVRFTNCSGRPIDLPGGTSIRKGDPVIELHFLVDSLAHQEMHVPTYASSSLNCRLYRRA